MNWRVRADSPLSLSAASIWIRSETWADVRLARPRGHADGVLVEQPAEGLGEYEGVSRGADREFDERRVGDGAEHIADQRDLGLWVERPQDDQGGSLAFEQVEEQLRGARVRDLAMARIQDSG